MNYNIEVTDFFQKQAKRLIKKYPSLKGELKHLISELQINPLLGKELGNNCFKIRLAIASKNKGKSGGARIITHFKILKNTLHLISIYDKSELDNISDKEIIDRIKLLE